MAEVSLGNPLLRKVPETKHLIKLDKMMVVAYLRARHPNLTDEERAELLAMRDRWHEQFGKDTVLYEMKKISDWHRRKFIAAAWLLGASQHQLAIKFGVRQQTIQRHVQIELPNNNRGELRLATKMDEHTLESHRELYYAMIEQDNTVFEDSNPMEIAAALSQLPLTTEKDEVKPHTLESAIEQAFDSTGDQS